MSEILYVFLQGSAFLFLSFLAIIVLPFFYFKKYHGRHAHREIMPGKWDQLPYDKIIKRNASSFIVLLGLFAVLLILDHTGFTNMYQNVTDFGWFYFGVSIFVGIVLHDVYFFFTHYLMHRWKGLLKYHVVHHEQITPSPLSAYYFHPVEAFIQFFYFLALPLFLPMHMGALAVIFIFMLLCNSAGHLPLEFYPEWIYRAPYTRWCNAATHHIQHHKNGNTNFSIYYTILDRLFSTLNEDYYKQYKEVQKRIKTPTKAPESEQSLDSNLEPV